MLKSFYRVAFASISALTVLPMLTATPTLAGSSSYPHKDDWYGAIAYSPKTGHYFWYKGQEGKDYAKKQVLEECKEDYYQQYSSYSHDCKAKAVKEGVVALAVDQDYPTKYGLRTYDYQEHKYDHKYGRQKNKPHWHLTPDETDYSGKYAKYKGEYYSFHDYQDEDEQHYYDGDIYLKNAQEEALKSCYRAGGSHCEVTYVVHAYSDSVDPSDPGNEPIAPEDTNSDSGS
jgi:hypothetical protein